MVIGDYHTHTYFSDGRSSVKKNIARAKEIGLKEICISDHGYASLLLGMTDAKWKNQKKKIKEESGINILHGIESNIFPDGTIDVEGKNLSDIDVLIVGFHRFIRLRERKGRRKFLNENGFASLEKREKLRAENTEIFIKAIENYPVDIIAHMNNRTLVDVKKLCEVCRDHGVYVELNEKHLSSIKDCIRDMIDSACSFILSTDAHKAGEVGGFAKVLQFIKDNGIPEDRVYGIDKTPVFKKK
ncbi:MAG: PHP domain-containing protein [Clostridia bacterium]|nr:PHP domain-containing protein [Clostridia bacterium]